MASEITDKEVTSVRALTKETLKTDVRVDIGSIDKVLILEKLKKNKENYHERYLVIIREPGRLLTVKSALLGKSVVENILIITINEIKHFIHNNTVYCLELSFNDRTRCITICTKSIQLLNKIIIQLLSVNYMISQCLLFDPKLTNISKPDCLDQIDRKKLKLSNHKILALSYQILCILEAVVIDKHLYGLFIDRQFHESTHIFDMYYILRHYSTEGRKTKNKDKYKINPREILVIIHALNAVESFTHLHLDGIPISEEIATRLAKLMARNNTIHSIALRKTQINAKIFYSLNQVIDKEIVKNDKLLSKMKVLDHLTLSNNNLQITGMDEKKKRRKTKYTEDAGLTFFSGMDGNVLCVKRLYVSRCNLNRELLSELIDAVINYKYLEKIDLSFNNFQNDSIVTFKLSQFCKKIEKLQALLIRDCQIPLTFLQDLVNGTKYDYRDNLEFLDLSGNIMTHYAAIAIGTILQNTFVPTIKIDLSNIKNMDHTMLEAILFGPFRAPFKNMYIDLVLSNVGFDNNEYLKALSNTIRFAVQQKNDCNGIQSIDLSSNNLWSKFDLICESYISNFYCLESLKLDFNFKLNKSKKGFYAPTIKALCSAIAKLPKLTNLSLCGDWANNLYLTYDDLLPLLQFLANTNNQCHLEFLCLDGNRIQDNGCKVIANSLKTNNKLKLISIEDNKCTFKGFKYIIDTIVECKEIETIKLIDIPIHSILDDTNFKSKIKKNRVKIEQCIKIIQENRKRHEEEQQAQIDDDVAPPALLPRNSTLGAAMSISFDVSKSNTRQPSADDDDEKGNEGEGQPTSPGLRYAAATNQLRNVDKLALMLSEKNRPKLKSVKGMSKSVSITNTYDQEEKTPPPPLPPTDSEKKAAAPSFKRKATVKPTKAKVVSSGVDAELNKTTTTANKNNAKSKRKKKTRKKLDV